MIMTGRTRRRWSAQFEILEGRTLLSAQVIKTFTALQSPSTTEEAGGRLFFNVRDFSDVTSLLYSQYQLWTAGPEGVHAIQGLVTDLSSERPVTLGDGLIYFAAGDGVHGLPDGSG